MTFTVEKSRTERVRFMFILLQEAVYNIYNISVEQTGKTDSALVIYTRLNQYHKLAGKSIINKDISSCPL